MNDLKIPSSAEIRKRLEELNQEASALRSLLRVAERLEKAKEPQEPIRENS